MERLDKRLAATGKWSRKEARELIRAGRAAVDGQVCRTPEQKVGEEDAVTVDGVPIGPQGPVYLMLNKPAGVVSSTAEPGERTVLDLLGEEYQNLGIFPAGRLDKDTEGLLLLTNEGPLAHALLSPKRHVDKIYYARVDGCLNAADCAAFAEGLSLDGGLQCLPAALELPPEGGGREALVTLREGKFHQVKRMLAARGAPVVYLERVQMAGLALDRSLPRGGFRFLTEDELAILHNLV